jgi:hypothetical protein
MTNSLNIGVLYFELFEIKVQRFFNWLNRVRLDFLIWLYS